MSKITNREIAQLAGVSPAAVSIAMNGKQGISAETRARILEIARQYHYCPNAASARILQGQPAFVAALFRTDAQLEDQLFYSEMSMNAMVACRDMGYTLVCTYITGLDGTIELPQDTVTALQDALVPFCSDLNGDGKVVVKISQYTVDFSGEGSNADAYYQMAGVTQLSAEVTGGETFLYILQDPAGFEKNTGVLRYRDGTQPDDAETLPDDAWQQMVYRWSDCPVLTGLALGQYEGYTLMDSLTGDNQDVLANLYIGARGVWDDKNADKFAAGEALWQQLTAGAAE